jgi:hypothetical protein
VPLAGTSFYELVGSDRFTDKTLPYSLKNKPSTMKQIRLIDAVRTMVLTAVATFLGFWAMAQEESGGASVNVSTTKTSTSTSEGWYTSPWVWVVGAAVFILLLVALLNNRGGGRARD